MARVRLFGPLREPCDWRREALSLIRELGG